MAKLILTSRRDSKYNDVPGEKYHFPRSYLNAIQRGVGDWAIHYEPRRGRGRQKYIAVAQITHVIKDLATPEHYYAHTEGYLEFPYPVPYRIAGYYYESGLRGKGGSPNLGRFQRAVRSIPDAEFAAIVSAGLNGTVAPLLAADPLAERDLTYELTRRAMRDSAFSKLVRSAYNSTCALTGIRILNGGDAAEMEAAHIRPVSEKGPDIVKNGIALSRTVHWLFDRGFISFEDNGNVLVSPRGIPDPIQRILRPRLWLPTTEDQHPHPRFLSWHRKHKFKVG